MPSSTSSSEGLRPAHPLSFFDPEHVDRPTPARPWRAVFFAAVAATLALTAVWEVYWRSKAYIPGDYENTAGRWAQERRKAVGDATVMIGSSRIFFDIDLDVWEEVSGVRPVMLALEGTSPRIFLKDLAEDENFNGLVLVGVTTILFFTQDGGIRGEVLDYARKETPSQRLDHQLSKIPDAAFAFFDLQTRPKRQIELWPAPLREGMRPVFDPRKLAIMTDDRNTEVWSRVVDDPAYKEEAVGVWALATQVLGPPPMPDGSPPPPMPDEAIMAVIDEVKGHIAAIRARGGDVAFLRFPYEGGFAELEDNAFPRERFWDRLIAETGAVGVAFHDYEELQGYELAEWSHLTAREAERYTRALAPIFYEALDKKRTEQPGD